MQSREPITLASLRRSAGLTQRQVAIVLNVREATVSDWERRLSYPQLTLTQILQLTILYRCSLEDLSIALDNVSREQAETIVQQKLQMLD